MKWRGVLFLRFLLSLVDESEKIRQLADYLFGSILKGDRVLTVIIFAVIDAGNMFVVGIDSNV